VREILIVCDNISHLRCTTALHVTAVNSNENFETDSDEEQNRVAGINIYIILFSKERIF
jgi:hypothetical protein